MEGEMPKKVDPPHSGVQLSRTLRCPEVGGVKGQRGKGTGPFGLDRGQSWPTLLQEAPTGHHPETGEACQAALLQEVGSGDQDRGPIALEPSLP